MSRPFAIALDELVVVRVLVDGLRVGNRGKRYLPSRGLFGALHAVRHDIAADLVRKRCAQIVAQR